MKTRILISAFCFLLSALAPAAGLGNSLAFKANAGKPPVAVAGASFPTIPGNYLLVEADTLGLANGNAVNFWTNKIGNWANFTNETTAPFWTNNAGAMNGKPWVQFTIGNGMLTNLSTVEPPYCLFALLRTSPLHSDDYMISERSNGPELLASITDLAFGALNSSANYRSSNIFVMIRVVPLFSGLGTNAMYVNGTLTESLPDSFGINGFSTAMSMNYQRFGSGDWNMWAMGAITNRVITEAEQASIVTYFTTKYGKP